MCPVPTTPNGPNGPTGPARPARPPNGEAEADSRAGSPAGSSKPRPRRPGEPELIVRASGAARIKPGGPDLGSLRRLSENAKPSKLGRDINPFRVIAFLAAAALAVIIPWTLFSGSAPAKKVVPPAPSVLVSNGASGSPSVAVSAPASPSVSGTVLAQSDAGIYEIVGTVSCVRIRVEPSTSAQPISCVNPGVRVNSDGEIKEQSGFAWLHVEDPASSQYGWIATKYVKRVRSRR